MLQKAESVVRFRFFLFLSPRSSFESHPLFGDVALSETTKRSGGITWGGSLG
jgi:hypothetical protein